MPLMSAGSASPTNSCAVPANRSRPISSRLTASNGTMATLRWPGLLQQAQASASWPMASVTSVAQAAARRRRCEGMVTGGAVETEPPIVCSDAVEIVSAPGRAGRLTHASLSTAWPLSPLHNFVDLADVVVRGCKILAGDNEGDGPFMDHTHHHRVVVADRAVDVAHALKKGLLVGIRPRLAQGPCRTLHAVVERQSLRRPDVGPQARSLRPRARRERTEGGQHRQDCRTKFQRHRCLPLYTPAPGRRATVAADAPYMPQPGRARWFDPLPWSCRIASAGGPHEHRTYTDAARGRRALCFASHSRHGGRDHGGRGRGSDRRRAGAGTGG